MKVEQQQEAAMFSVLDSARYKNCAIHFPVSIGSMKQHVVSLAVLAVCLASVKESFEFYILNFLNLRLSGCRTR